MALRWVAAGMIEANKGFRRLKAHKQLSVLRAALQAYHDRVHRPSESKMESTRPKAGLPACFTDDGGDDAVCA